MTAFANYSDFRTGVLKLIDGDDANSGALNQDTLDLLIALGEARVYNGDGQVDGLRASTMQAPLTGTVASNAVALPADLLALEIVWFDPERPLEAVPEREMRGIARWNHGGNVRQYAQSGDTLIFAPTAEDGATLGGRYYQKPAAISAGLHSTFNRYPEVYLYGALAEAAVFIGDDQRIPVWEALFQRWMGAAQSLERNRAYDGSRLRVRVR